MEKLYYFENELKERVNNLKRPVSKETNGKVELINLLYFETELQGALDKIRSKEYTTEDIETVNKCLDNYVERDRWI